MADEVEKAIESEGRRVKIADLPQSEEELSAAEAKTVKGGVSQQAPMPTQLTDLMGKLNESLGGLQGVLGGAQSPPPPQAPPKKE